MSFETVASTVVVLAILVGLIAFLAFLKKKGKSFTFRVFTALGLGVVFGAGIQIVLGLGTDATKTALDWMSIVGQGYINLLKMLVMPLVFVAIVGAFTRAEVTDNLGKIGAVVLVVLLATVAIAAIVGWAVIAFSGLAGASFADGTVDPTKLATLRDKQETVAALTIPQELLSFIPTNVFADFTGSRSTSTIAVVIFSAIVGVAYLKLRDKDSEQAEFFKKFIDALYGIVMRIVNMVLSLTPYGVLALIANFMAKSDFAAVLDLGKFVIVSYVALDHGVHRAPYYRGGKSREPDYLCEEGVSGSELRIRFSYERRCVAHEYRNAAPCARRRFRYGEFRGKLRHVYRPEWLRRAFIPPCLPRSSPRRLALTCSRRNSWSCS